MKPALIVIGLLGVLVLVQYVSYKSGEPQPPKVEGSSLKVTSYGESVFYFDARADFGQKLTEFMKAHSDLRIVSVAPLDNSPYGTTRGYWVIVEKRELAK